MSGTIRFVVPSLFDHGGIARISRAMALALSEYGAAHDLRLDVHALTAGGPILPDYLPSPTQFAEYEGNRWALGRAVLRSYFEGEQGFTVFGHVNLAALGNLFPVQRGARRYAVVVHGIDVWGSLSTLRVAAMNGAARIWAVSDYTARSVVRLHGTDKSRLTVIKNCIDPFWTRRTGVVQSTPERPYFLCVARLSSTDRYKGVDHAILAFARIAQRHPRVDFHIVGSGDDRARLMSLSERMGLQGRVKFLGAISDEDLRCEYQDCTCFILPSCKEGFGLVYLEAMSEAKPIIAASSTAVPEVVVDGETGLLVSYGDVDAMADAMNHLLVLPQRAQQMGVKGLEIVASEFSYAAYRRRIFNALDEAITSRRASA